MPVSNDFLAYVLEQLAGLEELSARRMFSGAGLYSGELFFAIIADDVLYLRADDASRGEFVSRGMGAFNPNATRPERPQVSMSYYETPAAVLEDREELVRWAQRAVPGKRSAAALYFKAES